MQCYIPIINSVCLKIGGVLTAEQRLANNQTTCYSIRTYTYAVLHSNNQFNVFKNLDVY